MLCPQVAPQLSEKGRLLQSSSASNGFKMDSRGSTPHANPFCSKASDDILRDLGLDLWENRKGKLADMLENVSKAPQDVQLFRPRHGTGGHGLEDSGLGIQKRYDCLVVVSYAFDVVVTEENLLSLNWF